MQLLRESVRGYLARFDAFDDELTAELIPTLSRDDDLAQLRSRAKEVVGRLAPLASRNLNPAEVTALADFRAANGLRPVGRSDAARRHRWPRSAEAGRIRGRPKNPDAGAAGTD